MIEVTKEIVDGLVVQIFGDKAGDLAEAYHDTKADLRINNKALWTYVDELVEPVLAEMFTKRVLAIFLDKEVSEMESILKREDPESEIQGMQLSGSESPDIVNRLGKMPEVMSHISAMRNAAVLYTLLMYRIIKAQVEADELTEQFNSAPVEKPGVTKKEDDPQT